METPVVIEENPKEEPQKKNSIIQTLIPLLILILGIGILVYPSFSNWWNSMHQSRYISSYITSVDNLEVQEAAEMIEAAQRYNASLLEKPNIYAMTKEDLAKYNSLLDITGTGLMGYIRIDSISVDLPIYHTTSESVLQKAIGHIEWSSLPVASGGTHVLLSGHRGLPSALLFTNLDKLVPGDTFTVTVLKETTTYMVEKIIVVEPEDVSDIRIVPGVDYCTLVTCTPYAVNTHRLLVMGRKVDNAETQYSIGSGAEPVSNIAVAAVAGVPILFFTLTFLLILDIQDVGRVPSKRGYSLFEVITGKNRRDHIYKR